MRLKHAVTGVYTLLRLQMSSGLSVLRDTPRVCRSRFMSPFAQSSDSHFREEKCSSSENKHSQDFRETNS